SANSPAMVAPRTSSRSGSAACAGARQAQARQASRPARFTVRRTRWGKTGIEVGRTLEWSIRTGSLSQAPERSRRAGRQPKRMTLYALGINHQTAPVALREQVAFGDGEVPSALAALRALPGVREVALLSTCNRTELYASADDDAALADWLASHPRGGGDLHAYLYRHADDAAARHLFRVACGLDSMVLGEPQILGQVKQAWTMARDARALGGELDRLFQHAFVTAKRARTETRIGSSPVSVASLAVRLAQESFARPDDSVALLI